MSSVSKHSRKRSLADCDNMFFAAPEQQTVSRRSFIMGTLALRAAGLVPIKLLKQARAQTKTPRIDFYHHLAPPTYIRALKRANLGDPPTFT